MKRSLALFWLMTVVTAGCVKVPSHPAPKGTVDPQSGKSCYHCHRSKITGPFLHQALAEMECVPCHQLQPGNHQLNHALFAVKDKSAQLCRECHEAPANPKSVHPVIKADGCIACHSPHTARFPHLLKIEVPQLCFDCHDRALAELKDGSKVSDFRDGTQNLHYVHAGAKNAIPCLTCHDVHASPQPHLVRPKGVNGKEAVTISYTATDKGGSCTPSCHDQLSYQRK